MRFGGLFIFLKQGCNISHVFQNVFVELYYLQMIVARRLFSTIIGRRGRYGSSLFRDQSGAGGRMLSRTARRGAAVALSTGGAGLQGVDAFWPGA